MACRSMAQLMAGVFLPVFVPEIVEDAPVIGGGHVIDGIARLALEGRRVLGRHLGQIQLAGLQLHGLGVGIGNDLEHDGIDVGRARKVIGVLHQGDGLAHVPALQLIGAGAHRCAEEVGGLHVLPLQQVPGQDGHGHVLQKRRVHRA